MSINTVNLKLVTTADFNAATTGFKSLATEAKAAGGPLTTLNTNLDKVTKTSATIGGKLKSIGTQFAGTITSVAALGASVVNLSRQYQDLGDSQIAVEKAQRRVSTANEGVAKAQAALNNALSKYGKGSAQAKQAALDLAQAQSQLSINTQLLTERQEDHQRAQENFWMGLVPTILTAGAGVASMVKEMGGSLGGLASKLKGLGGIGGGIGGLTAVLGPLGLALAGVTLAIGAYSEAAEKAAKLKSELTIADNAKTLKEQLEGISKAYDDAKVKFGEKPFESIAALFPSTNELIERAKQSKLTSAEEAAQSEKLKKAKEDLTKAEEKYQAAVKTRPQADDKAALAALNLAKAEVTRLEAVEKLIPATEKLTAAGQKAYGGQAGTLLDVMTKGIPAGAISTFNTQSQTIAEIRENFKLASDEADRSQFFKWLSNPNPSAVLTKALPKPISPFKDEFFLGAFGEGGALDEVGKKFEETEKTASDAAKKIADSNAKAAAATKLAWDKAFASQQTGIEKVLAAFEKMNPDRPTTKGHGAKKQLGIEQQFASAEKEMDKFMASVATKLTSPQIGEDFVTNFVKNVVPKMGSMSKTMFQPITDYAAENAHLPADQFMAGLLETIGKSSPTLASTLNDMYYNGTKNAEPAGTTAGEGMATGFTKGVVPLETKATAVGKQLDEVAKAREAKTTLKVLGQAALNQAQKTVNAIKTKTVTVTVKANLDRQLAGVLPGALANAQKRALQFRQHGFEGTIKRPTMIMVGEGGRQEDVSINPRGSAGLRGKGGSASHITISFLPAEFAQFLRYKVNENQGIFK